MLNKNNFSSAKSLLIITISTTAIAIISIIAISSIRSLKADNTKAEPANNNNSQSSLAIAITNENNANGNINLTIDPTKKNNIVTGKHTLTTTSNNATGYNISLQTTTNNNNLVNSDNPNAVIKPIDATKEQSKPLENKTWGYAIATDNTTAPTTFSPVQPKTDNNNTDNNAAKTIISSQTPTPVSGASTTIYYGVSLYDVDIAQYAGTYRTTVEYTITPKLPTNPNNPTNPENPNTPNDPNKPYALDPTLNIRTDYDKNMIPIKYTGTGSSGWVKADPNNTNGDWFNYSEKKWANVATINTIDNVTKYQQAPIGTPIENDDIKGFWVYIPRYAYEVMRRDAVDKVVQPQNFDIKFETTKDIKKTPKPCDSTTTNHKDYRTECGIDRTYPGNNTQNKDNTTWATHPAFTWGDEELNGIWVGKFELTGSREQPAVLPNKPANGVEPVGSFYNMAKSIGVEDPDNIYGGCEEKEGSRFGCLSSVKQYNQHNLHLTSSHMIKDGEWGAAAYLSASQYGAGVGNIRPNLSGDGSFHDDDGDSYVYSNTGCLVWNSEYDLDIDYDLPCLSKDLQYNGKYGYLASTTNNIYGAYDMAGGNYEVAAGLYNVSSSDDIKIIPVGKYADNYPIDVFPEYKPGNPGGLFLCNWQYCGGKSFHETLLADDENGAWNSDRSDVLAWQSSWSARGGWEQGDGTNSIFSANSAHGYAYYGDTTRAVLAVSTTAYR